MSAARYGLIAEFATADRLVDAARKAYLGGYRRLEAYSPFAVEGLADAIGFGTNRVPLLTFLGGIVGGVGGYFMQWYSAVVSYPINVGGRPLHSWPSFIPATFELTILGAALAAVFGMLLSNGLPRLYHPIFNAKDFDLATRNRFFLCILSIDPLFSEERTRKFLEDLQPLNIGEVPQ
jgi:hypothetical protein